MREVLFIGDSCIDINHFGHTKIQSPESKKINIFTQISSSTNLGMVFNTYNNFNNISKYNKFDFHGAILTNDKINAPIKHRFYDESGNMIFRYDENDRIEYGKFKKSSLFFNNTTFVVVSDYDKGFLNYDDLKFIAEFCNDNNIPCLIDTKKILTKDFNKFTFIKLNQVEFNKNKRIIDELELIDKIICTMADKGCNCKNINYPVPYEQPKFIYPEGCGDTFVAGFVCNYLNTRNTVEAIKFGMSMAGRVLGRKGVILPYE